MLRVNKSQPVLKLKSTRRLNLQEFPIHTNICEQKYRIVAFTFEMTSNGAVLDFAVYVRGEKVAADDFIILWEDGSVAATAG